MEIACGNSLARVDGGSGRPVALARTGAATFVALSLRCTHEPFDDHGVLVSLVLNKQLVLRGIDEVADPVASAWAPDQVASAARQDDTGMTVLMARL